MSIKVMNTVWEKSANCGSELFLLIALADWADDWGYCYPSIESMARKIRVSERQVYRLINNLVQSGELRIVFRGTGGRTGVTSLYQIIVGMTRDDIALSEKKSSVFAHFSPDKLSGDNLSGDICVTALKELINHHNAAVNDSVKNQQQLNDVSGDNLSGDNLSGDNLSGDNLSGDNLSGDNLSGDNLSGDDGNLPEDIIDELKKFDWRGSLADVEKAWREDPERVRQWLWYAKKQGWKGALLRTVLRNAGEYPPELAPDSDASRNRFITGDFSAYVIH